MCWSLPGRLARAPRGFLSAASSLRLRISKFVHKLFKSRVSVSHGPLISPSCLSSHIWGLVFLVLDPRSGLLNMWLEPLHPHGRSLSLCPPLLWFTCYGCESWLDCFPSTYQTLCGFLYNLGCRRAILLVFRSLSVRVILFSRNIPPLPSPTEAKSLFYTSASLFLFCI